MDVGYDDFRYAQAGYLYEQVPEKEVGRVLTEDENARIAAAALFGILGNRNACKVETTSVYGSAVVMPQFARSSGYNKSVSELAARSLMYCSVNIAIQGCILALFSKEQSVWNAFASRMNLCDFGATLDQCPNAPGCTGPGGTQFQPLMRYSFIQWMNRNFVKSSITALFPERADEIADIIKPGEYGVESNVCRILCCFMFMMGVTKDAIQVYDLVRLLRHVPTEGGEWMYYVKAPGSSEPELSGNRMVTLDGVRLKIAGIPFGWKVFNFIFILLPKMLFCFKTAELGISFLMNTSDITDSIVNSMALVFILNIDELVFDTFTAEKTKYMMDHTEPFHLNAGGLEEHALESTILFSDERCRKSYWCPDLFPNRLLLVLPLTSFFLSLYYWTHCQKSDDGTWVSQPVYLPKSLNVSGLTAYFPMLFPIDVQSKPIWEMGASPVTIAEEESMFET